MFFSLFIVYRPPALRAFNDSSNALLPPASTGSTQLTSTTVETQEPQSNSETTAPASKPRTRRPDRAVYVPRARRSQTTPPSTVTGQISVSPPKNNNIISSSSDSSSNKINNNNNNNSSPTTEDLGIILDPIHVIVDTKLSVINSFQQQQHTKNLRKSESIDETTLVNSCVNIEEENKKQNMAPNHTKKTSSMKIIDDKKVSPPKKDDDCEKEEKELRKASQEMNRASKRIIKQTFNSNVLEIEPQVETRAAKNGSKQKLKESKSCNPEEDDWESMFDDNGECLDPNLLDELTAQVGKVTIEKPKTDYKVRFLLIIFRVEQSFKGILPKT